MHVKSAACLAALLTRVTALALPQSDDVSVGGTSGDHDQVQDLISAYESVAADISDPVSVPEGVSGTHTILEDSSAVEAAAAADATSGSLEKREVFKRGTCATQPSKFASGPDVRNKTADEWKAIPLWNTTALAAKTPSGFFQVPNWRSLAAVAVATSPKGSTSDLTSYDPAQCAQRCKNIEGCTSFNIFFERAPDKDLDKTNCPHAAFAQTVVKCGFWGLPLTAAQATNPGQFRGKDFFTTKAGSNAYTVVPTTPDGFSAPVNFNDASIKAPKALEGTYMGIQTFADVSYNPQVCADACNAKSAFNQRQAARKGQTEFRKCRFFNSYVAYKNNADPLFTCTYYTESFGPEFATNVFQFDSAKNKFTKGSSYGWTLDEDAEIGYAYSVR